MGIPSFYRHLCRKFKHILSNTIPSRVGWLCLDFNCGMYGCLHSMRPYDGSASWESDFCYAIASYMEEIIALVKPTEGVFVACDGVVCAAKRRQQRLRRFKGPWMSASEAYFKGGCGDEGKEPKWDQNALTPGSEFMTKLNKILTQTAATLSQKMDLHIIVSPTSEPGEGEHKLLAHMRRIRPSSCIIYGLDADLLLLSLLLMAETDAEVYLLREAQEFERTGQQEEDSTVQWKTLSIRGMATAMNLGSAIHITDFVATMSLLGNDFLPRSMTRTIREDGIPKLLESLMHLGPGKRIVLDGKIQKDSLLILLREWAATEEADMLNAARRALRERYYTPRCDPDDLPLKEWQSLPGRWASLSLLLNGQHRDSILRSDWRDIYRLWHSGSSLEFCQGLSWVWDYYNGVSIDHAWAFDYHLPPLWSDIVSYLEKDGSVESPPIIYPSPLPEWLHLLAVLPADSVARLLPPRIQRCMAKEPLYWPTQWSFFDIGRSQLWECEPIIPILPEQILRSFQSELEAERFNPKVE